MYTHHGDGLPMQPNFVIPFDMYVFLHSYFCYPLSKSIIAIVICYGDLREHENEMINYEIS